MIVLGGVVIGSMKVNDVVMVVGNMKYSGLMFRVMVCIMIIKYNF